MSELIKNIYSKILALVLIVFCSLATFAQEKPTKLEKPPYDKMEEILNDGKRYRIHNNYLTIGGGFSKSSIRTQSEKCLGIDFQFHVKRQYFQTGVMMSGPDFGNNNNILAHVGYGYRIEKSKSNLAAFIGPSYSNGVEGMAPSPPIYYDAFGIYASVQGVTKFWYDVGIGLEVFGDVNYKQSMYGFKIIVFFSGAYKGEKRNYNPNVHSENPK